MRTKLIFVYPAWEEYSNKYYISFYKKKISYYNGLHPLGMSAHRFNKPTNCKILINEDFEFKKMTKIDKIEKNNTKATHEIICRELHDKVYGCHPYCVRLNFIQSFYLNWHFQKYIIQAVDFKKNILSGVIGIVLGVLATLIIQSTKLTNNEPKIAPIKENQNQEVLNIDKKDTTILINDSLLNE